MSLPIMNSFEVVSRKAAHWTLMALKCPKSSCRDLRIATRLLNAADAGESAASSADDDEEGTENEGADCVADEMDEIKVVSESEPGCDDEFEDEEPENVDEHGNFEVPDGMHVLPQPPVNLPVASLEAFQLKIALKWPFGGAFGWEIGKIAGLATRAGRHKATFVIRLEDGVGWYWPELLNSQYGGTKYWVLMAETGT